MWSHDDKNVDTMKKGVAIRELKARLSHYLHQVKRGEIVAVSDRGKIIAEIYPVPMAQERAALFELKKEGLIHWNGLKPKGAHQPLPEGKKLGEHYVSEGRR